MWKFLHLLLRIVSRSQSTPSLLPGGCGCTSCTDATSFHILVTPVEEVVVAPVEEVVMTLVEEIVVAPVGSSDAGYDDG